MLESLPYFEPWSYSIGDDDRNGLLDLTVTFNRQDVLNQLPNGEDIEVILTGIIGTSVFEGYDIIKIIK